MKTKLLRRVRKEIRIVERNGEYHIFQKKELLESSENLDRILSWYRGDLIERATEIFGFRAKKRIR